MYGTFLEPEEGAWPQTFVLLLSTTHLCYFFYHQYICMVIDGFAGESITVKMFVFVARHNSRCFLSYGPLCYHALLHINKGSAREFALGCKEKNNKKVIHFPKIKKN